MEHPVFMTDDLGGVVYVDKNLLTVRFEAGDGQEIEIDTSKLLALLESRSEEEWNTNKFEIEPMHREDDGALLVRITILYNESDADWATVFRCDLIDALKCVEVPLAV